ncbi:MAG: glutamate-cysteine ligase family protein [candidate division WOR-3 bacterium]|nr:glutamate-cysteine ligase family protein [candidate division WOR-3 bacterium]
MAKTVLKLEGINPRQVVKALELAEKEGETNLYGIEKEFAFVNASNLYPLQKIGRQSTYKFVTTYGNIPFELRRRIMPEVFDYMIEVITEPEYSYRHAVEEILKSEAELWYALSHIQNEFPNMDEILLSSGTLFKPAQIENENIPEVWGKDKKAYLEEMVRRYGEKLTPQGMHGNISIPEPLIAYQYHRSDTKKEKGSTGYVDFKNEVYVWLACKLRAFASLIIAIEANSPFDYLIEDGEIYTVLTGYHSNRWKRLPQIESTNHPFILRNYTYFQRISLMLINKGIIIGANNYMPIRPKGERRLGEVPLSFERACWLHDIVLNEKEIASDPLLSELRGLEDLTFIEKLEIAERTGWLKKKGYKLSDLMKLWQKDNVRRLLGVPLNRLEIRCEESGGDYEFERAKAAFLFTLSLYLFANPEFGAEFTYGRKDLKRVEFNESQAMKQGLNCEIIHPFSGEKIKMRDFLSSTLNVLRNFALEIGTYEDMTPLMELSKGKANESEKKINTALKILGKNPKKTKNGFIIIPDGMIRDFLLERKKYLLEELSEKLNWGITKLGESPQEITFFKSYK